MKSLYKSLTTWLLCLFFVFSSFIVSFADVRSLMIGSSSNALMTLELDDSDYSVMPMSTFGSVTNTLWPSSVEVIMVMVNENTGDQYVQSAIATKVNGRYKFSWNAPSGYRFANFQIVMPSDNGLPSPGTYKYSIDFASDFAITYDDCSLLYFKSFKNAASVNGNLSLSGIYQQYSGDYYVGNYLIDLTNVDSLRQYVHIKDGQSIHNIGGSFAIRFVKSSESGGASTGANTTEQDYQDDVSSSLSDLSSSVDSMTEDLSSAAESLEYISTSQNLIIQGIDNVVMHISDQLFAFWNQLFNLIHVPTMAKMDDIITAINNMDLEIEVNLDGLKSTINNMSTAVQNKLQSTTDQITGGYDNSGIAQENEKLEQSINQYDEVESGIFEDAEGFIGDFEYPSVDSLPLGIIKALAFVGSFLQGIFLCMGDFSVIITFSLTMIFVMVVVGYHRIRS